MCALIGTDVLFGFFLRLRKEYILDFALDGEEAVRKCDETAYSIIFMDLHMPNMDGIEATRHIRKMEKRKGRRRSCICAVTATTLKEQEEKCIEVGMEYFMTKPFQMRSLQLLLGRIERKLKKGRSPPKRKLDENGLGRPWKERDVSEGDVKIENGSFVMDEG